MSLFLIHLAALAAASSALAAIRSGEYVEAFQSICLAGYGDLKQVTSASKAAGFKKNSRTAAFPDSLYATKGGIWMVYRGTLQGPKQALAPQCSIQIEKRVSDSQFEALASSIELKLQLQAGERFGNGVARHMTWRIDHPAGKLRIVLAREVLATEPHLRLGVQPASE